MQDNINIFDHKKIKLHKDRIAEKFLQHNFLIEHSAKLFLERFSDIKRKEYKNILYINATSKKIYEFLTSNLISDSIDLTLSSRKLFNVIFQHCNLGKHNYHIEHDEYLNLPEDSFDLIISFLSVHWINNLPNHFVKIRRLLRKQGMFMAIFFGDRSLLELRKVVLETDIEIGRITAKVSPFVEIKSAGMLMQRAEFCKIIADSETIMINYADPIDIIKDIKYMGESNALVKMNNSLMTKNYLEKILNNYKKLFFKANDSYDLRVDITNLIGFKN